MTGCAVAGSLLLGACGAPGPGSESPAVGAARVVSVVDGDTFEAVIDGPTERVRLIGINAPESSECHAERSTAALEERIGGERVVLVSDQTDRDDFDRLLRYVEVGDVDVGAALVEGGHAIARRYEPDTARSERYERLHDRARREGVGLWAPDACGPAPAPGSGALVIGATRFDAEGPDTENLLDEWVRIDNTGRSDVDLTGWSVRDESASNRYDLPDGLRLRAGEQLTLRTGCGSDSGTELHWCRSGAAVWNNDGDTAFLLDPAGNIVDAVEG